MNNDPIGTKTAIIKDENLAVLKEEKIGEWGILLPENDFAIKIAATMGQPLTRNIIETWAEIWGIRYIIKEKELEDGPSD